MFGPIYWLRLLAFDTGRLHEIAPAPQLPQASQPAPRPKANKPFTAEDYELIRTVAALDEWIVEATKAGVVGVALETDGSGASEADVVGLSFALLEGPWGNVNSGRRRAAYLPLGHRAPGAAKEKQGALDLAGDGGAALLPDQLALKTALAKLKHAFPGAKVIAVGPVGGSTPVLSTTAYGTAHQVSGFKPTASQLASGAKEVQQESKEITGNYVKSQQGLPDSISVP